MASARVQMVKMEAGTQVHRTADQLRRLIVVAGLVVQEA